MDPLLDLVSIFESTIRLGTPLILAALGGLLSERAGIVDLGIEGKLLAAAFAAASAAAVTGSAWMGLAAGMLAAMLCALLHGLAAITYGGSQLISGMAINILVAGLTPTLASSWFHLGARTPLLAGAERFGPIALPLADRLGAFGRLVSGHNLLVYLTLLLVPLTAILLYRTRFGLRLRAVGDNPEAVEAAGISVAKLRYLALLLGAALCGIGGAYLSLAQAGGFVRDMSAGKGYVALAALIAGRWRPLPACAACLLFAFADALQLRLQGTVLAGIGVLPVQAVQALPYVVTVVLLAFVAGKSGQPRALGLPFRVSR
jgi:general nucleoside transport system permease protein